MKKKPLPLLEQIKRSVLENGTHLESKPEEIGFLDAVLLKEQVNLILLCDPFERKMDKRFLTQDG